MKLIWIVSGHDIAEQIVWAASRPEHVQIAEMRMFSHALLSWVYKLTVVQSSSLLRKHLRVSTTRSLNSKAYQSHGETIVTVVGMHRNQSGKANLMNQSKSNFLHLCLTRFLMLPLAVAQ